jgi:prophage maintenance system killer protein
MALALYYLYRNNYNLRITNTEYEEFMLHVVRDKPDIPEITNWLIQHRDKRIL